LKGKAKSAGAAILFIIEEGVHDEKVVTTLNSFMDVMIHLKKGKNEENLLENIEDRIL